MKQYKAKTCKCCGVRFRPVRSIQPACSPKCAIELGKQALAKQKDKQWKEEKKVLKEKLKTLGEYEQEARREFQKWIRKRDQHLPCISCGTLRASQWDGGHYYKAEIYSGMIFDEDNCHKQCSRCNDHLSGNLLAYREGLIKRYGEVFVITLETRKDAMRNYKYSKQELFEIKEKYKSMLKN